MKIVETLVGSFILFAASAMFFLAFKVSGSAYQNENHSYEIAAAFDNVGDLKPRAPVTIGGVKIGQVTNIHLSNKSYKAVVHMRVDTRKSIPIDSEASIVTAGLLGANYVAITPGFEDTFLKDGDKIQDTHPAIILEEMLGQLMFSLKNDNSNKQ